MKGACRGIEIKLGDNQTLVSREEGTAVPVTLPLAEICDRDEYESTMQEDFAFHKTHFDL